MLLAVRDLTISREERDLAAYEHAEMETVYVSIPERNSLPGAAL